jgi:hypothetical protein
MNTVPDVIVTSDGVQLDLPSSGVKLLQGASQEFVDAIGALLGDLPPTKVSKAGGKNTRSSDIWKSPVSVVTQAAILAGGYSIEEKALLKADDKAWQERLEKSKKQADKIMQASAAAAGKEHTPRRGKTDEGARCT